MWVWGLLRCLLRSLATLLRRRCLTIFVVTRAVLVVLGRRWLLVHSVWLVGMSDALLIQPRLRWVYLLYRMSLIYVRL